MAHINLKAIWFLASFLSLFTFANAQTCGTAGVQVILNKQSQVDDFLTGVHLGCTHYLGSIRIMDDLDFADNIVNLNGLAGLVTIDGNLIIDRNFALQQIDGLASLQVIQGNLQILNNDALTQLNGLQNLQTIGGDFFIDQNDALISTDGLSQIQSIGGNFMLFQNNVLTNVNGLLSLQTIGGYLNIQQNPQLNQLIGLKNVTQVGGFVLVSQNNALQNCCGLFELFTNQGAIGGAFPNITFNATGCNSINDITSGGPCLPAFSLTANNSSIPCGATNTSTADGTDFGEVEPGVVTIQTFTITNNSTSEIVSITGGTSTNPKFTLIGLPSTLPPASTATFDLAFQSDEFGIETSTIEISNNSILNGPTCSFSVQASQNISAESIPTLGEWGMIFLCLLLLNIGIVAIKSRIFSLASSVVASTETRGERKDAFRMLPIDRPLFIRCLVFTGLLALLMGGFTIYAYGFLTTVDVFGTIICGPMLAYLIHMLLMDE